MHPYLCDDGGHLLASQGTATAIAVAPTESTAVLSAADALAADLRAVCGAEPTLQQTVAGARIVVGTLGVSPLIDDAVASGALAVDLLRDEAGDLRWEAFLIQAVGEALYVVGTDRRGTVFGIYDLCEAMGVSPWYWFGDVPVRTCPEVRFRADARHADWPGVAYRGIFINDEEELERWAQEHTGDDTIGPETYARLFELVLRLKGNYVWPAMHVNAFNLDPANGRLADDLGVVIGSSHCDMLLRSNEHEFEGWAAARPEPVAYDYSLPGRNRDELIEYWRGSVRQNGGYEVSWTVGMRGIHDTGFSTAAIDGDDSLTEVGRHRARVDLLGRVIADQRRLLVDELGDRGRDCLQLFIPYKEVLPLYDGGLELPDDVTVVWANDNFGYVRRYPTGAELDRPGGHGLYYHSSYWSVPPRSYLATSSTPLALMRAELTKAWDHGIRRLWVDNVGGLKPLELETEFFLRCAWQAGKETTTSDVAGFVATWFDANFSGGRGAEVGELYARYYRLNNQRKIEHLDGDAFSLTSDGDEAARRVRDLTDVAARIASIAVELPIGERDAFLQLIGIKVHLAYLVAAQFAYADRSRLALAQGRPAAADAYTVRSKEYDACKRALLHSYNEILSDGRWSRMLEPESSPPPAMALAPAATPALTIGEPGLGVAVRGREQPGVGDGLTFWPDGRDTLWIDVFSTGAAGVQFEVTAEPWLKVSPSSGVLDPDVRLQVSVPELVEGPAPVRPFETLAGARSSGTVVITAAGQTVAVPVSIVATAPVPSDFSGSIEADGHISIDPSRPDGGSGWRVLPWLGRDHNDAVAATADAGALLEYRLFLHTPGAHTLELHRLPTLNSTGRIRVGISVDGGETIVVESPTTDEYRGDWEDAVLDNVERLSVRLPHLDGGGHVLRLHAVDEHVTLSKLIVHTAPVAPSNLGPSFSRHTDRPFEPTPDPDPGLPDALPASLLGLYRVDAAAVPPRPTLYVGGAAKVDPDQALGRRYLRVEQTSLPEPPTYLRPDGTKDVVTALGTGAFLQVDGRLAIETECALADDEHAHRSPGDGLVCTHTDADTAAGGGLAMRVDAPGRSWDDPSSAPAMHYVVDVEEGGEHEVWLLIKQNGYADDDSVWLAVDGAVQPVSEQHFGGDLFGWDTTQLWHWVALSRVALSPGRRQLSLIARRAGLRVDRLFLTRHDELPPDDGNWVASPREGRPVDLRHTTSDAPAVEGRCAEEDEHR